MASKYECEVRFLIKDIESFRNRIKELGGVVKYPYEFTDYYYKPKHETWDPVLRNIRIRKWVTPDKGTSIQMVKNNVEEVQGIKFKKSLYKEGKIVLFTGSLDECKDVLKDLNFEHWFTVEKNNCKLYEIKKHNLITIEEFIPEIGWTGELEIEGDDLNAAYKYIKNSIELLQIPEYTFKSVSRIVAEAKGLL